MIESRLSYCVKTVWFFGPSCIIWVPWKFSRVPEYAHGYFSRNFNGLLFRSILWMRVQNLKFVAGLENGSEKT